MHVLIVPSERYGDPDAPMGGVFQRDQARALRVAGIRVGVLAPEPRSLRHLRSHGLRPPALHAWDENGVRVVRVDTYNWATGRLPRTYATLWRRRADAAYRAYVRTSGTPDLVHAHNVFEAGVWATASADVSRVPIVITEHSSMYWSHPPSASQLPRGARALERARARLVVSRRLGDKMRTVFGDVMAACRVVPNVLPEEFERRGDVTRRPSSDGTFRFLCIAAFTPVKNHRLLVEAFARATRSYPDIRLHLVGDGPLRASLRSRCAELGIDDRVSFHGYQPRLEVQRLLDACDAAVLTSHVETVGTSLIEALSAGRPVIAIRGSGPDDFVDDRNGVLVEPDDAAALSSAMETMRREAAKYDAATIRAGCVSRFGSASVAAQLIDVYRGVLGARAAGI